MPRTKQFGKYDKVNNCYRYYDFVVPSLKLCIEYNGDYWHANPEKYKTGTKILGRPVEEIWARDKVKKELLESFDYKYIIVWDDKYRASKEECLAETLKQIGVP